MTSDETLACPTRFQRDSASLTNDSHGYQPLTIGYW